MKNPKARPKPETECFYCEGNGHWKRNCPKYLADKKDGKVNKGIFDIMLFMCTLLVFIVAPGYLIPVFDYCGYRYFLTFTDDFVDMGMST